MTSVSLAVIFNGNILSLRFNDSTSFSWDPLTPHSNAQWQSSFGASPTAIPQDHLDVVILPDTSKWTMMWFPAAPTVTILLPQGSLTIGGLLQAMSASVPQNISPDDCNVVIKSCTNWTTRLLRPNDTRQNSFQKLPSKSSQ